MAQSKTYTTYMFQFYVKLKKFLDGKVLKISQIFMLLCHLCRSISKLVKSLFATKKHTQKFVYLSSYNFRGYNGNTRTYNHTDIRTDRTFCLSLHFLIAFSPAKYYHISGVINEQLILWNIKFSLVSILQFTIIILRWNWKKKTYPS